MKASPFHSRAHLGEDQLLPPDAACPLCLSSEGRRSVLALQSEPDVSLLSCACCGGFSASRMPTPETLRSYYSHYYGETSLHVTFHQPARFASHIVRKAFRPVPGKSIDILDFGGGDGELSRQVARRLLQGGASRARVVLIDYTCEGDRSGFPDIPLVRHETLDAVAGQSFHLVVASAILEHIPCPRPDMTALLSAVGPGGIFYARTPTVASLFKLCRIFRIPCDFTFPGHLHDLGQAFWRNFPMHLPLAENFEVIASRPSLVETTFRRSPLRTVAAYALKAPWYLFGRSYDLVGGWEVFLRRRTT